MRFRLPLFLLLPCLLAAQSVADLQKSFEKKVTEFTLANGLHFIVIERHDAPVVSFHTYVNVGSVDDPGGETGLAHMFEHMAFKGTPTIGTKNWLAEKAAMDAVEQVYDRLDAERNKGPRADSKKIEAISNELVAAMEKADSYVEPNEYDRVVESSSQGKLIEALSATAFSAHPYHNEAIGWASDIEHFRRPAAERFYRQHYVPANITLGIAGDVNPMEARRLAEKYFGRLVARPVPLQYRTVEPLQEGEKTATVSSPAQPFVIIAYKRPDRHSPDAAALAVLDAVLSDGRTGIIYKEMVRDKQIALGAGSAPEFPGGKYPSLFLFYVAPSSGHTSEENRKELDRIIQQVKTTKVDDATLQRVKIKLRAGLIRKLDSNAGLASELCTYYVNYGDWRKLFTELDEYDKVTADDVARVANTYLVKEHRTVAYTYVPDAGSEKAAGSGKEGAK